MSEFAEKVAASDAAKKKAPAKKRARRSGVTKKPAAAPSTKKVVGLTDAVRKGARKAKAGKLLKAGGRLLGRATVPLAVASATYEGLKFLESKSKPVPTRNKNRVTAAKKVAKPAAKKVAKKKSPFLINREGRKPRGKMAALERHRARTAAKKK
jgi:hypothetical protein